MRKPKLPLMITVNVASVPLTHPTTHSFYSPFLKVSSLYTILKSALSSVLSTTQAQEEIYILQLCLTSPL